MKIKRDVTNKRIKSNLDIKKEVLGHGTKRI